MLDACRELGVTLIAYQPLASGALTGKYADGSAADAASGASCRHFRGKGLEARRPRSSRCCGRSASATAKSPAQVALRWLIENELSCPSRAPRTASRRPTTRSALTFSLTPDEIEAAQPGDAGLAVSDDHARGLAR